MARYLVGPYNNSWNFMDAVEKAQNGDTIEFEDGYAFQWPTDRVIVIKKSLHFVGHVVPNPNSNGRLFNNTIEASFQIAGGAEVSFENLWFKITDNYATFSVLAGSKISCNQIYFETTISENKKFMIFAEANSTVILNDVGMTTPEKHNSAIKIVSSELSISNATVLSRIFAVCGSKVSLDKVYLQKYDYNTIHVRDSEVTLKDCTVEGGNLEEDYPMVWLRNVIWQSENSTLEMPRGTAVNLNANVQFRTVSDRISTLRSFESTVLAHDMTITEFLGIDKESFASLKGVTNFLTESQKKIPFGAFTNSVVLADHMIFHKIFRPNLRINGSSFVKTNALSYAQGDARDLIVELEDGSDYIVGKESAHGGSTANSGTGEVGVKKRDAIEELNNLVGLEKVKHEIKKMINMVEFNKKRIASGKTPEKQTLHAAFMGNPGTGKTTVARLLGEALYEAGVLSGEEFRFVEATESDLISSSVGGTAEQTQHLLEKARGGILFIDEAYSLDKKGGALASSWDFPAEYQSKVERPPTQASMTTQQGSGYPVGQCTWYAYNRLVELGTITDLSGAYGYLGNGQDWVASLVAKGWRYSTSPTKGAVVSVLGGFGGTPGEYGHVAIVEAVNSDGSFLVSECNIQGVQDKVHFSVLYPAYYYTFATPN